MNASVRSLSHLAPSLQIRCKAGKGCEADSMQSQAVSVEFEGLNAIDRNLLLFCALRESAEWNAELP